MGKQPKVKPTFAEVYAAHCPPGPLGKRARMEVAEILDDATGEVSHRFYCRGLGGTAYRKLLAEHPPTDEDHQETQALGAGRARWSVQGFPRALIQASCVEPALSDQDMAEMFEGGAWNEDEITHLFAAAYKASTTVRTVSR